MEWSQKVYKIISKRAIYNCAYYNVTANQITIFNNLNTIAFGCFFFSRGIWLEYIFGLCVMLINGFLDYLDGDLAKQTKSVSRLGEWLDSGFDVILQNCIMAAIALGCYKQGLDVIWIALFFVSNTANNFVSFNYNQRFMFNSSSGNELFRKLMDKKRNLFNRAIKNITDPTSSFVGLCLFTLRYFIAIGALFNIMPLCFVAMTIIGNIRWIIMYSLYALELADYKNLHAVNVLRTFDEDCDEFYKLRNSKTV